MLEKLGLVGGVGDVWEEIRLAGSDRDPAAPFCPVRGGKDGGALGAALARSERSGCCGISPSGDVGLEEPQTVIIKGVGAGGQKADTMEGDGHEDAGKISTPVEEQPSGPKPRFPQVMMQKGMDNNKKPSLFGGSLWAGTQEAVSEMHVSSRNKESGGLLSNRG